MRGVSLYDIADVLGDDYRPSKSIIGSINRSSYGAQSRGLRHFRRGRVEPNKRPTLWLDYTSAAGLWLRPAATTSAVTYIPRPKTKCPMTLFRRVTFGFGVLAPAIPEPIPGIMMK
jgi:hypothetical protein